MECNRGEAIRAKEIAERKFSARDVAGAKKFAIKAQNLFPGLEGISQMLSTLDVHLFGDNKIGNESDWYGILGVSPLADDDTVRKKYRKLALMLHPDKNKSIGAEGAFKLISEAWSLLSDKVKRTVYDQRRLLKTSQQKVPSATGASSATPPGANGFHNITTPTSKVKAHKTTKAAPAPTPAPAPPRHSKPNTFWTACHRCKMQYEYLRVYQNHKLLCPNCHEPFLATETPAPPIASNASGHCPPPKQRQNSNHNSANKSSGGSGRKSSSSAANMGSDPSNQSKWSPFSGTASGGSAAAAQAASVVQQAYEKVKRDREEAQAAGRRQEALWKKSNHGSKRTSSNSGSGTQDVKAKRRRNGDENAGNQTASGNGGASMASGSGSIRNFLENDRANSFSTNSLPNIRRDLSQLELRNMLIEKAKRQICKKLDECKLAAAGKAAEKEKGKPEVITDREKEREEVKETANVEVDISGHNKGIESVDVKKVLNGSPSIDTHSVVSETEARTTMSITVPDPDFHDFDRDRSEKCFGNNQVWAAYDDDDGMPRYYAIIHKMISVNPFKMRISWLNSKTNTELGPLNWTGSGFSKTCGDFRVGKHEFNSSLNSFSHKVRWTKGARGVIIIFPKKGDVWAVYRNWSPDWNELTPDEVIHKYDMVEVLEDYTEDQGVTVTPLVKVAGFKTVFHRHLDTREVRNIRREEMFRFSHQVPSCLLTGSEAPGAPKGCRELDPAATPVELLQIVTEAKEELLDSADEETKARLKEVDVVEDVVEIVEEEMMVEAKEKMIIEDYKESDVEEEKIIELPKEEDVMEIVEEELMILEGEDGKTIDYNSSRNRMIRSLFEQEEDTIEIAVEEMSAEVEEKEITDDEEEPMEEDIVEIPDLGEPKEEKVSKNDERRRAGDDMEDIITETKGERPIAEAGKKIVESVSDELVKNNGKQKDTGTGQEATPEGKDNQSMKKREQQEYQKLRKKYSR